MDLYQWIKDIGDCLRMKDTYVWVGFSFLMKKPTPTGDEIVFCYAARELSIERSKVHSIDGWTEFADRFKGRTENDVLSEVFASKDGNPFKRSGFYPYKLVTANIWIRK